MYTNGASAQILPMQRKTAKRFIRPPLLGHAEGESKPQRQRFGGNSPAGTRSGMNLHPMGLHFLSVLFSLSLYQHFS